MKADRIVPTLGSGDPRLSAAGNAKVGLLYVGILLAMILSFFGAYRLFPAPYSGQITGGALIFTGLATTAGTLGLDHGFDDDHIAAIGRTTRKLVNDGKRPLTLGSWFAGKTGRHHLHPSASHPPKRPE